MIVQVETILIIVLLAVVAILAIAIVFQSKHYNDELDDEVELHARTNSDYIQCEKERNSISHDLYNTYIVFKKLQNQMNDAISDENSTKSAVKQFENIKDIAITVKTVSDIQVEYLSATYEYDKLRKSVTMDISHPDGKLTEDR